MSSAALARPAGWSLPGPMIVGGLLIAAVIAWLEPFDRAFAAVTLGQPALRAGLIVALAIIGAKCGRSLQLQILPQGRRGDLAVPLGLAVGVALGCLAVDLAFGPPFDILDGHLARTPLAWRLLLFVMHVFNEEILYRLFLGSVLAWLFDAATGGRRRKQAVWIGLASAQVVNVTLNVVIEAPVGPMTLLYDALRYFAPGLVWTWLYVRRGFRSAETGHLTVHLIFQPLVGLLVAS